MKESTELKQNSELGKLQEELKGLKGELSVMEKELLPDEENWQYGAMKYIRSFIKRLPENNFLCKDSKGREISLKYEGVKLVPVKQGDFMGSDRYDFETILLNKGFISVNHIGTLSWQEDSDGVIHFGINQMPAGRQDVKKYLLNLKHIIYDTKVQAAIKNREEELDDMLYSYTRG